MRLDALFFSLSFLSNISRPDGVFIYGIAYRFIYFGYRVTTVSCSVHRYQRATFFMQSCFIFVKGLLVYLCKIYYITMLFVTLFTALHYFRKDFDIKFVIIFFCTYVLLPLDVGTLNRFYVYTYWC